MGNGSLREKSGEWFRMSFNYNRFQMLLPKLGPTTYVYRYVQARPPFDNIRRRSTQVEFLAPMEGNIIGGVGRGFGGRVLGLARAKEYY